MRACVCIKCLNFAHHEVLATSRNPPKRLFIYPLNKVTKDETTYNIPDDSPQMASEPAVAYDKRIPPCPCQFTDEELDEEIRLAEEEGYMSVAETREFLLRHHIHSTCDLTVEEIKAIYEGKEMTAKGIETLKQKEYLTIEEMQALLLNMVDEEYSKP